MIAGLIALIGMILGGGSTEYFYIAEFLHIKLMSEYILISLVY